VRISIPIIGLPSETYSRYLGARAEQMGFKFEPPIYPPSLRDYFDDPVKPDAYTGKKILSIHGELDTLVPIAQGQPELDQIAADNEDMEIYIQKEAGHVLSVDMLDQTAKWVWKWAIAA
jgi:predicted esterase